MQRGLSFASRLASGVGLAAFGTAVALAASPARAADEATAASSSVAEVTVTAQKRAENLQDVPLSVSVVGAQALQAAHLNQSVDLQFIVPGVQVSNAAGPRSFGFYIRGIGTNSFSSESVEGSVAYVLDGVVLGQAGASLTDLPDIERVEVLRGPQGTLFGKNASAGVINIVTRRPSATFSGGGTGSWATPDNDRKGAVWVSGPLGDQVRVLFSLRGEKRDGIVHNVFDGRRLNDVNDWGVRGKVEWQPSSRLTVTASADYWRRNANCCVWTLRNVNAAPSALEQLSLNAGIVPGPNNEQQNINGTVISNVKSGGAQVTGDLDLGGGYNLTAITAWRSWHTIDGLDSDNSPQNVADVNFADFNQHQWTQEVRVASPLGGFIDWVGGVFFFDANVVSVSTQKNPTSVAAYVNRAVTNRATTTNYALFGQANFNLTKSFRLIAGVRVLRERATADKLRVDLVNSQLADPPQETAAAKTANGVVWRFGAQYDITRDANVFATITRGYKAGGFDTNIGFPELRNVLPEVPTNVEVGLRTAWFERRMTLNVTFFHNSVKDYQVSAQDVSCACYYLTNASQVLSQGVEFESAVRPFDGVDFLLNGSLSYIDAHWASFTHAACYSGQTLAEGCVAATRDITGQVLPRSPKWTANLSAHYSTAFGVMRVYLDGNVYYRASANVAFPTSPFSIQPGYALANASIGVGPENGRFRVGVFVKNIGDAHFVNGILATPNGKSPGGYSQYPAYEAHRIFGVSLDANF